MIGSHTNRKNGFVSTDIFSILFIQYKFGEIKKVYLLWCWTPSENELDTPSEQLPFFVNLYWLTSVPQC